MTIGGDGPWAITVMWICTAFTFVFVLLRTYTRVKVVQNFGIDDHVYNFAFLLLLIYTTMTTIAALHGFGQNMTDIPDIEDLTQAILFEAIGQTFAVVGMAVAKWSLGLFLLRLVTVTWHKVAIWITMGCLMSASVSVAFVFWLQCSPPAYLYDRRIEGGYCYINTTPVSFTLCILCVVADFFFAIFPWMILWNLNMNQREKIVIAASMSLGLIAGACGIKRTIEVPNLVSQNYLKDTVGLIVWSAAEIAVTMICIGIPVCRPLYKSLLDRLTSSFNSSGYKKHNAASTSGLPGDTGGSGPGYGLHTIGGSTMPGREGKEGQGKGQGKGKSDESAAGKGTVMDSRLDELEEGSDEGGGGDNENGRGFKDLKLGINGPFTKSKVVARGAGGRLMGPENSSDEEILGMEYKRSSLRRSGNGWGEGDVEVGGGGSGEMGNKDIHVRDTWRVTRS